MNQSTPLDKAAAPSPKLPIAVAVVAILLLQLLGSVGSFFGYLALVVPPLLLLATTRTAPAASRAGQVYFLYFLNGISRLAVEAYSLGRVFQAHGQHGDFDILPLLAGELPSILGGTLLPIVIGIAFYIVLSAADEEVATSHGFLDRIAGWIAQSDAPEEVRRAVMEMTGTIAELQSKCTDLSLQTDDNRDNFIALATACRASTDAMAGLQRMASEMNRELRTLSAEAKAAHVDIGQLGSQISEFGEVLDQFAEVANHKILQYAPVQR